MNDALSLFGDAMPADPAADACPACGGPTSRRGRECLPCLAAGVTAVRLDLTADPKPQGNADPELARLPRTLADWPHPYPTR